MTIATTEDTVGADGTGGAIVSLDARAVQASVQVVSLIGPADLARPTPCGDWTLDELLTHMTVQHDGFAGAAAGGGADLSRWQPAVPAADPVGEYIEAFLGRRPEWPELP